MEILIAILSFLIISSVQWLCRVWLCNPMDCSMPGFPVHPNSQSLLKLVSIESVMPSNHLILCHFLLLLPSIFFRVFSNESVLHIRWPKITQNNCVYLWLHLFHFYIIFFYLLLFLFSTSIVFFPFFHIFMYQHSILYLFLFYCLFLFSIPSSILYFYVHCISFLFFYVLALYIIYGCSNLRKENLVYLQ